MNTRITHSLVVSLAVIAPAPSTLADVYQLRVVAQTGDNAPSSLGGTFTGFGSPRINASGQVAFVGKSDGLISETGLWWTQFNAPQTISLIVGQDFPVPGAPRGTKFGTFNTAFHHPLLNDNGNVGFAAPVALGEGLAGIFRMIDGTITKVMLPNDPVPGFPADTTFKYVSNLISFNAYNLVSFAGAMNGPGILESNDEAFFLTWFGGVDMVIREGNVTPGIPGSKFGAFTFHYPLLADNGQIAFDVPIVGATTCDWSRWRGWPGGLQLLAKHGDPTPLGGTLGGGFPDFWTMSLPTEGASFVENIENVTGATPAVWMSNGVLESVVAAGQPGPIGTYQDFAPFSPATTIDGTVALVARFSGIGLPATKDSAVVLKKLGEAGVVLLREGDAANGFGAGVEIADMFDANNETLLTIANSGWLFVSCPVRGLGINALNDRGYWAIDPDGDIHFIARKGQWISFDGEPARQLGAVFVSTRGSMNDGRRGSLNERGDVAMTLAFNNGDQAVVVAQLPPACAADLNDDGVVDAQDLAIMLGAWGTTGPVGTGGDVDWDGDSDAEDLAILLGAWGNCEP